MRILKRKSPQQNRWDESAPPIAPERQDRRFRLISRSQGTPDFGVQFESVEPTRHSEGNPAQEESLGGTALRGIARPCRVYP